MTSSSVSSLAMFAVKAVFIVTLGEKRLLKTSEKESREKEKRAKEQKTPPRSRFLYVGSRADDLLRRSRLHLRDEMGENQLCLQWDHRSR